jgi:hypothetical protein
MTATVPPLTPAERTNQRNSILAGFLGWTSVAVGEVYRRGSGPSCWSVLQAIAAGRDRA